MKPIVTPDGTTLYKWPGGVRYVPPPTVCQGCEAPATEFLSWRDKMNRVDEFAGCATCAKRKQAQAEASGFAVSAFKLGEEEGEHE